MKKLVVALALVAAGCAGGMVKSDRDALAGHWAGVVDRDGWRRPLSLDVAASGGSYDGSWMSLELQPGLRLQKVERDGEAVRFELASLVFQGRLDGRTLAGTVADRSGSESGQFVLTRVDPPGPGTRPIEY